MVFKNSNSAKKQVYKEYLERSDLNELTDLKMVLESLIKTTENQKSKIGLEIILVLISHKKKDVKAFALGKLYILTHDKYLKKLVIKELKTLVCDKNPQIGKCAQNSLKLCASDANKFETTEIIIELLNGLNKDIQNLKNSIRARVKHLKSSNIITCNNLFLKSFNRLIIPIDKLEIKLKDRIKHSYNMLNYLTYKYFLLSKISRLFPELSDINVLIEEIFIEPKTISYSSIAKFELTQKDPINELATIYANTILEKGHIRRLEAFLDDENYNVRRTGVNALTNAANMLINSKKKTFIENLKISLAKIYPLFKKTPHTQL
jgi:hypothetical protein